MKTFKNKNYIKRNYEVTDIVACRATVSPSEIFIECDDSVLIGLTKLYIMNGVEYYGYL